MRIYTGHNSDGDSTAANPTPKRIVHRPALRGGVNRSGEVFDPAPLTCIIFITMVHLINCGDAEHYALCSEGKYPFSENRQIRFHFYQMGKHFIAGNKTRHRRTRRLTVLIIQM